MSYRESLPSGVLIEDSPVDSYYLSNGFVAIRISRADIGRMHEIAFPASTNKATRYEEYRNDPVLKSLQQKLAHVLQWQAMPMVNYSEEIIAKTIPYKMAQDIIQKITTQSREWIRLYYNDIIKVDDEKT
jgi:hypothetical protein